MSFTICMTVLGVSVALSVVLVALVVAQQRLQVTAGDGISYLSIAQQYAEGDVGNAVNAYWSPMVSWLAAPLIASGVGLEDAAGVVSCVAAALVVGISAWLVWSETRRVLPAFVAVVVLTPVVMQAAPPRTPDLLVVAWVIGFLWALRTADRALSGSGRARVATAALLGVVVALGYFVKLYVLPVAVVSVVGWLLVRWWSGRRQGDGRPRVRRPWVTPVVVVLGFALVAGPWVGALSAKYDGLVLGSSFGVNFGNKFSTTTNADGWPFLPVPPNPAATTPNEDFTPDVYRQGPFDRPTDTPAPGSSDPGADTGATSDATSDRSLAGKARYYVAQRLEAFPFYVRKISDANVATLPVGFLLAVALVVGAVRFRRSPFVVLSGVVGLVYFAGYAAITSSSSAGGNVRYYWPLFPVAVVVATTLLPRVWRSAARRGVVARVAVALAVVALAVSSFAQNVLGAQAPFVASTADAVALPVLHPTGMPPVRQLAEDVAASGALPDDARVIGSNTRTTASLALLLGAHAYGRSGQGYDVDSADQRALFSQVGIEYFLQYDDAGQPERDYSAAGTRVASFVAVVPCVDDTRGGGASPCRVDVVRLDP